MRHIILILILGLACTIVAACDDTTDAPEMEDNLLMDTCGFALFPPLDTVIATHTAWTKTNYNKRITIFQLDTIAPNSIVMLGNSLTEQGGNWSLKLGIESVYNRGIAGDNCDGALARLGELVCKQPRAVFIMIGTNDLWTNYSAQRVGEKIDEIGSILAQELPEAKIYVQTLMPLGAGNDKAARLDAINGALLSIESRNYQLIDTFTAMAEADGTLAASHTTDGLHLTLAGYQKWVAFLKTYLAE
ncbi:MAG: lysophospholipase L1-like esterase [Marinoscillum sp.]|jgi:lysophospholipase L1-like esterase